MQFTFEGNYKPKRNINLGGVRSHEDKKTLLAKAQAERRARERERLRNRSAVLIQSFYRKKREAGRLRQQLRLELDRNLDQIPGLLQDPDSHYLAIQLISHCIRQLVTICRCAQPTDSKFVHDLCCILVSPLQDVPVCMAAFTRGYEKDPESWMWLLILLSNKVLLPTISKETSDFITPAVQTLSIITDEASYQQITTVNPGFPARNVYIQTVTQCFLNGRLLACLRPLLKIEHCYSSREIVDRIVSVLKNIAQCQPPYQYPAPSILRYRKPVSRPSFGLFSQESDSSWDNVYQPPELSKVIVWQQFVTQIFTIPFLVDRIPEEASIRLLGDLPFSGTLRELISLYDTEITDLSDEDTASLLMNITQFGNVQSGAFITDALENYAKAIQLLLTHLPIAYLSDAANAQAQAMQIDDESDSDYSGSEYAKEDTAAASDRRADPLIKERLENLYDTENITALVHRFMQHASIITTPDTPQQDLTHLMAVMAGLFNSLMIRWSSRRDVILNILLYHRWASVHAPLHIVHLLWQAWSMSENAAMVSGDIMDNMSSAVKSVVDTKRPEVWCILYLLCELYTRLLLTIGDDEFFDKKNTNNQLALNDIVTLSTHLKNISFVLYWKASSIDLERWIGMTGIKLSQLRSTVTHLVQQIHTRDARRPFCPKDHWLIKDLDNENFSRQVAAEELELENEPNSRQPSKGRLAIISPRLGVLNNIPFVIPFEQRVEIFRMFVANDRKDDFIRPQMGVAIRRTHVFEDGFTHLYPLGAQLKHRIPISFVDEFGLQEAGIDGGGVFKEFLTSLSHEAFDTNYGLFLATPDQLLYPNPSEYATEATQLAFYEFLGLIIGKALYEGILLDVAFAEFFLKKCLGGINYLDDLPSLDPELYRGLIAVKNFQGNVEDLSLDFTLSQDDLGPSRTVELIPGGKDIPVTNQNRIRYVYLVANYRLNVQIARQCKAFFRGLSTIIDIKWLRMFNQHELQVLLGGAQVPIDVEDLRKHTLYAGYTERDPVIQNFWQVLQELDNEQRQKFVKFVTSCSRPPLLGFKALHPQICIRNAGPDDERLPTSSTCINLLKLPQFSSKEILKRKLLYAINAEAGFDLS